MQNKFNAIGDHDGAIVLPICMLTTMMTLLSDTWGFDGVYNLCNFEI